MTLYKNKYRVESARLHEWDYSTPWWYYVTICTKDMKHWFGKVHGGKMILNSIGKIIHEEWKRTEEVRQNVELDYYQIMPNHFHGIIIINGPDVVETHGDLPTGRQVRLYEYQTITYLTSFGDLREFVQKEFANPATRLLHGNRAFTITLFATIKICTA